MLYVHKKCDAANCLCPNGREHIKGQGKWKLYCCRYCGSVGVHEDCREDGDKGPFTCKSCIEKEEILISTQTESSNNNNSEFDRSKQDEANGSNQKTESSAPRRERKHESDGEFDDGVWKLVPTAKLSFRNSTLHLTDPNERPTADPLCDSERHNMRQNRLDEFFSKAEFNSKPPLPPWII